MILHVQFLTSHILINITENVRIALFDGNIVCGVDADIQNVFDTVYGQVVLAKLNHCGIHTISINWFKSYISNLNQSVFINGYD